MNHSLSDTHESDNVLLEECKLLRKKNKKPIDLKKNVI